MSEALVPILILLSSFVPGIGIFLLPENRGGTRIALNLTGAIIKVGLAGYVVWRAIEGQPPLEVSVGFAPGFDIMLRLDALATLFVALSSVLWLATTVYAIGYIEGDRESRRFFGFFSLCITATMGIAMAGNLLTFFMAYEALTIFTWPLIVHDGTPKALRSGAVYLAFLLGASTAFLGGAAWLHALVGGDVSFAAQGRDVAALAADHPVALSVIFGLLIVGVASKAAIVPLHAWLPAAMVAPTPVSALLHAVAVVKAGAFGVIRIIHDVYGVTAHEMGLTQVVAGVAAFTIIFASLRALQQDHLKRLLAYSTISQLSYIVLGVSLGGPLALVGGLVHMINHGVMKITLFFCAGGLAETAHIHKVSEMNGIGRRMPWTMAAFTVAALGMIGLPPLAGFVTKWYLGLGALNLGLEWVVAVLIASALLNAAYYLPILHAAWLRPLPAGTPGGRNEAKALLLLPPLFTALLVLLAGLVPWEGGPLALIESIVARERFP
ncbi:complex I subunit 5 family protein [Caenispirillum salinarum]|uniref:complex I subunit 5 family protein n=1 Tax=Caenispirillum salinarum TaxID=859058 RepID=UPI00384CFA55